jgi:glycine/D-amino acid oxidase-like deaminating enzyme
VICTLIGKIPHLENLYLLTGLSSSGFAKGLMAGKLLAESINHGTAVPILSEADPAWHRRYFTPLLNISSIIYDIMKSSLI